MGGFSRIRDFLLGQAEKDLLMSLATASGARVPGFFFKIQGKRMLCREGAPVCS